MDPFGLEITEPLSLEKLSGTIKPNHSSSSDEVLTFHIHRAFKSLQGCDSTTALERLFQCWATLPGEKGVKKRRISALS